MHKTRLLIHHVCSRLRPYFLESHLRPERAKVKFELVSTLLIPSNMMMFSRFKKGRALSEAEKSAIAAPIASTLDLDKIEIIARRWTPLTPKNVTVARGYKIFYPDDEGPKNNIYHLAHLVHEIVHVWQYKYWGVNLYSPRWLNRTYKYELKPGMQFQNFGLEQQAALFEDHFRMKNNLYARWAVNDPPFSLIEDTVMNSIEMPLPPFV